MIHTGKTVETLFIEYLASKVSPAQLSELYMCYSEIEAFGEKLGILKKPLFETVQITTINCLRVEIEQNKVFRMSHKKKYSRMVTAMHHYYTFIRDFYKPDTKKSEELLGESPSLGRQASVIKEPEILIIPASNTTDSTHKIAKQTKYSGNTVFAIDFTDTIDLAYTKPISLSYFGEKFSSFSSWKDLYTRFISILCDDYPAKFFAGMKFSDSAGRVELTDRMGISTMISPKAVTGTAYFAETNASASTMGSKMKYILDLCCVDYENVVIRYTKHAAPSTATPQSTTQKTVAAAQKPAVQETSTDLTTPVVKKRSSSTETTHNASPVIDELMLEKAESLVLESDLDGTTDATISSELGLTTVATKALIAHSKVLVEVNGKVYHQDAFIDWEDGANQLTGITEKLMQKNDGYISSSQLYDYARMDMHMFLSDNDMNSERAVYDISQHLFEKINYSGIHYSFSGKMHISNKEKTIGSNLDVIVQYALDQGGFFSMEELKNYLTGIGVKTGNVFGQMKLTTDPKFFYYENGVLVLAESMGIDDAWKATLHSALKSLFNDVGDHIVLREIQPFWFDKLPKLPMGKHWTPLLLQSVLRFFSDELGARTICAMNTQAIDTLHTMLVQSESNIQNFGDAVITYLLENDVENRTFVAEDLRQLLVQSGMIQGNELIWNMPKALSGDSRFSWDASEKQVIILI